MNTKITFTSLLITAILVTASSCSKNCHWVKGTGPDVKNSRTTTLAFKEISVSVDANVELYPDSVYSIEMVGQQNVLDVITTSSNGTTLDIDVKKHVNLRQHNDITIRIHMPVLTGLNISGSGKITTVQGFNMVNMRTNVSGSGDIFLYGTISGSLISDISGSGNVNFSGTSNCNSARYTISGSGDMNTEWLKADIVDASISGSGGLKLYAVKQLNADISGSGNVQYRGTPETNVKISGSGKLKSIN